MWLLDWLCNPEIVFTFLLLLSTFIIQFFLRRRASRRKLRSRIILVSNMSPQGYHVVVVGAGCAGAAAVYSLQHGRNRAKVLLLDQGTAAVGSMVPLLSYTADLPATEIDEKWISEFPLAAFSNETHKGKGSPYPRGMGIGGTSNLDYAEFYRSVIDRDSSRFFSFDGAPLKSAPLPLSLAVSRSPVGWAFAETVASMAGFRKVLDAVRRSSTLENNDKVISPYLLRVNGKTGLRTSVVQELLDVCDNVDVIEHAVVTGFETDSQERVSMAERKSITKVIFVCAGKQWSVRVGCGVIFCAGVFGTPRLLRTLKVPQSERTTFVDTLCVPLIYQCHPGISDDVCNVHSLFHIAQWYVAQKGPLVNVVSDTVLTLDVPGSDGGAIQIEVHPHGGYNKARFARSGLSVTLGVFKEALTFLISIQRLPRSVRAELLASDLNGLAVVDQDSKKIRPNDRVSVESWAEVRECLSFGVLFCRKAVQENPLSLLTTGKEALDVSLFDGLTKQEARNIYCVLYSSTKALKNITESKARILLQQAKSMATSEVYVKRYVTKHTKFGGFGCSSLPVGVDGTTGAVGGFTNAFVGDLSCLERREAVESILQEAGGVATTMDCGQRAATSMFDLLRTS